MNAPVSGLVIPCDGHAARFTLVREASVLVLTLDKQDAPPCTFRLPLELEPVLAALFRLDGVEDVA